MLKLNICKRCRTKEYGKDAWNEFAEAWANPNYPARMTRPHIFCPADLVLRWAEEHFKWEEIYLGFINKLQEMGKVAIEEDAKFINFKGRLQSIFWDMLRIDAQIFWQEENPPLWCPYKGDHSK
jgi:hypothetical protein